MNSTTHIPTLREPSMGKEMLLIAWVLFLVSGAAAVGGGFVTNLAAPKPSWMYWVEGLIGCCVLYSIVQLPSTVRGELAEYRRRYPEQSLQDGRWKTLPYLRWWPLYFSAYAVSMVVGLAIGVLFGLSA